jgi:hypothetical protein
LFAAYIAFRLSRRIARYARAADSKHGAQHLLFRDPNIGQNLPSHPAHLTSRAAFAWASRALSGYACFAAALLHATLQKVPFAFRAVHSFAQLAQVLKYTADCGK